MIRTDRSDTFGVLDADLSTSTSRRDAVKRLGALGLFAASALALAPRAAEAKPKRGGKGGDPENRRGGGVVSAQAIADIPDPRISLAPGQSKYLIIGPKRLDDTYRVVVAATISFHLEMLTLMRAGRYFGLTCQIWSWKRLPDGKFGYRWVADMKNPNPFVNWGGPRAVASAGFSFVEDRVAARHLDVNARDPDYLHARLYIWTRAPGASEFTRYARQDGRVYFKLDTVQGNY